MATDTGSTRARSRWWIPAAGLLTCLTLVTAGFAWSIDRATQRYATDALVNAGIDGVAVDAAYRDVSLTGPLSLETAAVALVSRARLVKDVVYLAAEPPSPEPSPTAEPHPTTEPTPDPSPSPEPSEPTCLAFSPECLGGTGYLTAVFDQTPSPTFAFDSANLTVRTRETLDLLARAIVDSLAVDPGIRVTVAGHADSSGPEEYNERLSEIRARVVRDYLVQRGVPAEVLVVAGFGETRPIAANDTETGRALNRRVDLEIAKD